MNDLIFLQVMNLASIARGPLILHHYALENLLQKRFLKHKQMQKGDEKRVGWLHKIMRSTTSKNTRTIIQANKKSLFSTFEHLFKQRGKNKGNRLKAKIAKEVKLPISLSENQKVQYFQIWNQELYNIDKRLIHLFFIKITPSHLVQIIFFISDPLL